MLTAGVTTVLTVTVIVFDVSGLPAIPGMLEVMIHRICWPFVREEVVNVLVLVPAFTPFTCHWKVGVLPPL
jgi:hypothetical protein